MNIYLRRAPPAEKQSHMLDLLDVNLGEASGGSQQVDPWGVPIVPPPPRPQVLDFFIFYYFYLWHICKHVIDNGCMIRHHFFFIFRICMSVLGLISILLS